MGSKQTGQTNSSNSYTPPPAVLANYQAVTAQAQGVAATPYNAYGGPLVAGINGQQQTGIGAINNASGIQNPYNAGATGLAAASSSQIDPTQYSGQQLQQYENPYQSQVVNATEAEMQNQNAQQAASLAGNAVASGSFGGDRAGVAQAALAGQQDIANNATIAGLNTSNFQNAQNEFNTQQSVGLGAAQNTAARQLAASQQIGNLGAAAQTEALTGANAQVNAGTLQQGTTQAQDTAAYNQFLQQQAYPFQTTGWLANIVEGIGSQSGGTSNGQQTTQGGSGLSSVAGGLLGLASFLKDGGRVVKKAAGGGLTPYGVALDPTGGLGAGSYVTPANLAIGHTMPQGQMGGAQQQAPNQIQNMTQTAKSIQGLGNSFQNSSLGDSVGDFFQDNFAKGGLVRPRFDDGGSVSPSDLLWASATDPNGTGVPVDAKGPSLLPQDVNLLTPEAALAAQYAGGQMPAPQQDGLTPDQKLAVAMGAPQPQSGSAPTPAAPGPATPAGLYADATRSEGPGKLRTAMGGSNTPPDPNSVYGGLDDTAGLGAVAANTPTPPVRPTGLGAAAPSLDVTAPGGFAAGAAATPTQLSGAGLASAEANASPVATALGGLNPNARGMKNNNPGNLEDNAWTQSLPGYVGTDGRFAQFATPQAGAAALDQNLAGYGRKGVNTPLQIASTWAPGSEKGNNPSSYGAVIAKSLGVGINDPVDMSDPATRSKIGKAIAFVENGPGNGSVASAPASQAIEAATAPNGLARGQIAPQNGGGLGAASAYHGAPLTADSPVASSDAPPNQGGGLFGLHLSDSARQGMLSAGLGMLGGTSMNPFVNIGQGGLAGVKQYNDARKLQSEIGLQGAQTGETQARSGWIGAQTLGSLTSTQGAEIENQIKSKQRDLMFSILDGSAASSTKRASAIAASPNGVATPTVTAPTIAGAPSATSTTHTPDQVDPRSDPMALRAEADRLSLGGPMFKDRADRMYAQAAAIMSGDQQVQFTDGATGLYPGVGEAKARQAAATKEAEVGPTVDAAAGTKNFETQNALKTQTAAEAADGQNMLGQAMALRDRMFDPKTGQPVVNSGPYGAKINGIAATMKQLGISDGTIQALTHTDPNNAQEVEKLRTALGSEAARADLGGSQIRVAEWQRFLATTPGADLLPGAYKFILDNVIVPKAQQQIQQYDAIKDLDPKKDNVQGALFQYRNNHPAYAGPPPASPAERVKNGVYTNSAGQRARWSGTGWNPIQ